MPDRNAPWSEVEIEATVADYFRMLALELSGQKYSKTEHRNALLPRLNHRTPGAVELKHQNISAVLVALRAPWIIGYKPMSNYQGQLYDVVASRLKLDQTIDEAAVFAMEQPAQTPLVTDFANLLVPAPVARTSDSPRTKEYYPTKRAVKRDYLALESNNRSLGAAGEEFMVNFEKHRLRSLGTPMLADKVEWVAQTQGDGLGYDVLSFNVDGTEKWIEVKTTALGIEAPFFVSRKELHVSESEPDHFRLCRLFNFRRSPRLFELGGSLKSHCRLDAVVFQASF